VSRGLPAVARARGHTGPLVAQPDSDLPSGSESSTSEPGPLLELLEVPLCQWAGSLRLGTTVTARAPAVRHYELAHLLSNIEKFPLPIQVWGSMFPFWNPTGVFQARSVTPTRRILRTRTQGRHPLVVCCFLNFTSDS
jgi:hypothetical protein